MRMLDEATLYTVTITPGPGMGTKTSVGKTVYAERKSVTRAEWLAMNTAGMKADIMLIVNADDYDNQTEALYDGTRYRIIRSYQTGARGYVELTCEVIA